MLKISNGLRNYFGNNNPCSKLTLQDADEIKRVYVRGKHCENNSYGLAKKYNVSCKTIMNVVNRVHYTDKLFEEDMK